jgi:hypothetical protein
MGLTHADLEADAMITVDSMASQPPPPANLAGRVERSKGKHYGVDLAWDAAPGATSYKVFEVLPAGPVVVATIYEASTTLADVPTGVHEYYLVAINGTEIYSDPSASLILQVGN